MRRSCGKELLTDFVQFDCIGRGKVDRGGKSLLDVKYVLIVGVRCKEQMLWLRLAKNEKDSKTVHLDHIFCHFQALETRDLV